MSIVEWDDILLTGDPEIDQQHRELFRVANDLHQAILDKRGQEMVSEVSEELFRYSLEHFRSEERLMADRGYPQLAQHRRAHEKVSRAIRELQTTQGSVQPFQVLQFLISLIRIHIRETDAQMIRWIRENERHGGAPETKPDRLNVTN